MYIFSFLFLAKELVSVDDLLWIIIQFWNKSGWKIIGISWKIENIFHSTKTSLPSWWNWFYILKNDFFQLKEDYIIWWIWEMWKFVASRDQIGLPEAVVTRRLPTGALPPRGQKTLITHLGEQHFIFNKEEKDIYNEWIKDLIHIHIKLRWDKSTQFLYKFGGEKIHLSYFFVLQIVSYCKYFVIYFAVRRRLLYVKGNFKKSRYRPDLQNVFFRFF